MDTHCEQDAGASRGGGLVLPYKGTMPEIGSGVFLAPQSCLIGRAKLGNRVSVWFGTIVRGDMAPIEIGEETNLQDGSVIHVADDHPCIIGPRVVVGHRVILHGCRVEEECTIGMGAIVLNGAVIGAGSIIGAGSLIPEGKVIPPRSLVMGLPGKIIRSTTDAEVESNRYFAKKYVRTASAYLEGLAGG